MVKNKIIDPTNSPWPIPLCLVTKLDGSVRFCLDFRKLNDKTVKGAYPFLHIDDIGYTHGRELVLHT